MVILESQRAFKAIFDAADMQCSSLQDSCLEWLIETESDLDAVTRYDNIMMYRDKKNQEVILTNHLVDNSHPDEVH